MNSNSSDNVTDVQTRDGETTPEDLVAEVGDAEPRAVDGTDGSSDPPPNVEPTPRRRRSSSVVVLAVLVVLLLSTAGLASWLYLTQFRADQDTDAAVADDVLKASSAGAISLLSYAPETMAKDFANAKTHLTGDFLNYYSQFTHDVVTPAVQQRFVQTSATVVQSAVSELNPRSAVVLVFLNQTTTSKDNPNGSLTSSSVKVGLTKVDGVWLISSFDPV